MEETRVLKFLYTLFLGVLLALFIGVGIQTFYAPPTAPKYPVQLETYAKEPSSSQIAAEKEFARQSDLYQERLKPYNRNVSILALAAAIILLTLSILQHHIKFIADGVMIGGLFTLLYSIGRGFASEDSKYMFIVITIGLGIVIYLGYARLRRPQKSRNVPLTSSDS